MPDFRAYAANAARRYGVPVGLFLAQINQESGFNPRAVSPAGAIGIAQIVPRWHPGVDPRDPYASLEYAARLMSNLYRRYGTWQDALSAYNSGRPWSEGQRISETRNYVNRILTNSSGASDSAAGVSNDVARSVAGAVGTLTLDLRKYLPLINRAARLAERGQPLPKSIARRIANSMRAMQYVPPSTEGATSAPSASGPVSFAAAPDYRWAEQLARQYGLRLASTFRDPGRNRAVGGSPTSRHMTHGAAVDLVGPPEAMRRLAEWAGRSGLFAEVFYDPWGQWDNGRYSPRGIGGHTDHVHLSLGAPGFSYFYRGRR